MSARLAPFLQASAFAFRSFPLLFRLPLAFAPLGNKRHHHHHHQPTLNLIVALTIRPGLILSRLHVCPRPRPPSSLCWRMSARLAPSSRPLPSLFVAFLSFFVFPWPSPPRVINVIIINPRSQSITKKIGLENLTTRINVIIIIEGFSSWYLCLCFS
jgi:hypothetical protein